MAVSKYKEWKKNGELKDKLILIQGWAREGCTQETIAKNLGLSVATFENYKKEHIEFLEALKKGKDVIDFEVENALLKKAMGYEYDEITYEMGVETKRVTKNVSPDATALIFWLKNRKPKQWRDKVYEAQNNNDINKLDELLKGIKSSAEK